MNQPIDKSTHNEMKLIGIIKKLPSDKISLVVEFAEFIRQKYGNTDDMRIASTEEISESVKMIEKNRINKNDITMKINRLCDKIDTGLNPQFREAAARTLKDAEW